MRVRQMIFGVVEYETEEELAILQDALDEKLQSNTDGLMGAVQIIDDHTLSYPTLLQMSLMLKALRINNEIL